MRILKGHDYYDSCLAYGQDNELIFLRDSREVIDKKSPLYAGYPHEIVRRKSWNDFGLKITDIRGDLIDVALLPVSVYLAGKHYGGIKIQRSPNGPKVEVFWNYDEFEAWVKSLGKEITNPKSKKRYAWDKPTAHDSAFPDLKAFFTPTPATPDQLAWLAENQVAIALWCNPNCGYRRKDAEWPWCINSAEKNKSLADFDFPKAMDPFSLYQELSMFVGGVLPRNPNPIVEITDQKIKAEKHGFDKWSFRKHKEDNL